MQHDIGKYLRAPLAEHRARFSRIDTIIRSSFFLFRRDGLLVFFFPSAALRDDGDGVGVR